MDPTRREILKYGGGTLSLTTISGCLNSVAGTTDGPDNPSVKASFFTLYEFTRNIGGDVLSTTNAVPGGQHGHGWEPPIDLLPNVVESNAFVYLDTSGFQPWAERVAAEIKTNYTDDVKLIDALDGIEVLRYDRHGHDHSSDTEPEYDIVIAEHADDVGSVTEVELIDRGTDKVIADYHYEHWHGSIPTVPRDGHISIGATFIDDRSIRFQIDPDGLYRIDARTAPGAPDDVIRIVSHGDHVRLQGTSVGNVSVVFELWHGDDLEWESASISTRVGETTEGVGDHTHGVFDVKFFSDPVRAQQGVQNIRDGLIELDPNNASVYEQNAASYIDRLEDLHQQYTNELANREHDIAVLAGHNSFHYLADRYAFEIHTPVGLSPDDEPAGREIAATVEIVDEFGIEYILWDYFDGDRLANAIVAESESAHDTVMVSAAESYTESWMQAGYADYIGQMTEINLPSFKNALGASDE